METEARGETPITEGILAELATDSQEGYFLTSADYLSTDVATRLLHDMGALRPNADAFSLRGTDLLKVHENLSGDKVGEYSPLLLTKLEGVKAQLVFDYILGNNKWRVNFFSQSPEMLGNVLKSPDGESWFKQEAVYDLAQAALPARQNSAPVAVK
jgi:hypothetical protein